MKLLSLDCATRTGYAIFADHELVIADTINTDTICGQSENARWMRTAALATAVQRLVSRHPFDVVACEAHRIARWGLASTRSMIIWHRAYAVAISSALAAMPAHGIVIAASPHDWNPKNQTKEVTLWEANKLFHLDLVATHRGDTDRADAIVMGYRVLRMLEQAKRSGYTVENYVHSAWRFSAVMRKSTLETWCAREEARKAMGAEVVGP